MKNVYSITFNKAAINQFLITIIIIFLYLPIQSQSCLPNGIVFYNQSEIDSFSINYPDCSRIEGSVYVGATEGNISNLLGLSNITSIGSQLTISYNDSLLSLEGLENLDSVGLNLFIRNNKNLISIVQLESLSYVHGVIGIEENSSLTSLEGLGNFDTIRVLNIIGNESLEHLNDLSNLRVVLSEFLIEDNQSLSNLSGLESLIYAGEDVKIFDNDLLTDLNGLNNLQYIRSLLKIRYNDQLSSLDGLENLDSVGSGLSIWDNNILSSLESISNMQIEYALSIYGNPMLEVCNINSICEFLSGDPQYIEIYDNAPGCNTIEEVEIACDSSMCLLYGITLSLQTQIDSFPINYPGCTVIKGDVIIEGDSIVNLHGLNAITIIEGDLKIKDNKLLSSLTGLDNLTSVDGNFFIGDYDTYVFSCHGNYSLANLTGLESVNHIGGDLKICCNQSLTSLAGLDNLATIAGDLKIGGLNFEHSAGNTSLLNLSGLEGLSSIGGYINISGNAHLNSLTGIENIDPSSISQLVIIKNYSLSNCAIENICNYLIDSIGEVEIHLNTQNCNSREEVQENCTEDIYEIDLNSIISIFPNPTTSEFNITGFEGIIDEISIFNRLGQRVFHEIKPGNNIDVSWLPPGMYIVEVRWNERRVREKLIVQ